MGRTIMKKYGQQAWRNRLMLGAAMATVMGASVPAMAQDTQSTKKGDAGFGLEEIVVTAQKREATLLETPVAVSALTGESMEKAQIRDLSAMQTLMPSLAVTQRASASNTSFSIRGIGSSTFNFGIEPAVGVFVDGVYRSRNGASVNDFLGIQRVEVLRGPQSTLFGKNTSAGVINIITQEPTYEPFVEGEFTYGNYNATVAKAAVNLPAIEDKLAFRFDANYNKRDGIFTNDDGRKLNERDRYGFRGQMLFEPDDTTKVRVIADYNKLDENCCAAPFARVTDTAQAVLTGFGSAVQGAEPFSGQTHINGAVNAKVKNWGLSAQIDKDFDSFSITSITAYRDYKELQDIDADFSDLQLNKYRKLDQRYNTFTQEFRITSKTAGAVDWMAGAYYYNQKLHANNATVQGPFLRPFADALTNSATNLALDPYSGGSAISLVEDLLGYPRGTFLADGSGQQKSLFNQKDESFSAFAQLDWHATDKLTLTGGLRYTSDKKTVNSDIVINDPFAAINFVDFGKAVLGLPDAVAGNPAYNPFLGLTSLQFFPPASNINDSNTESELSGNFIANYEMSDQVTMYASYSRGFKAGGYALDSAAVRVGSFKFNKEVTTSYELGMKARLMDHRMSLDFALFDEKIKGFQENIFTGTSFVPGNVDAAVQGLEFDGKFQATPSLLLTAGFTYLWKAEYQNFPNGPCANSDTSTCTYVTSADGIVHAVQDLSGVRLSEVPKFTGNMTALYTHDINDDLEFFARGELYYKGYTRLAVAEDNRQKQDAYALVGASFGIGRQDKAWSLQFWARNLFNEHYILDTFDSTIPSGAHSSLNAYIGDPRTYGLTLRVKY